MDDSQLQWLWAYAACLTLQDEFDARGLRCAEVGWNELNGWNNDHWKKFLLTYSLTRGYHSGLGEKGSEIINAVEPIFKPALSRNKIEDLNIRWSQGIAKIGEFVKDKNGEIEKKLDGKPVELSSMASKLLWLYQPGEMTLYDDLALKGLKKSLKNRPISRENYLQNFAELYEKEKHNVDCAGSAFNRAVRYKRRVLDQWLWLEGMRPEEREMKLQNFRMSWELCNRQ